MSGTGLLQKKSQTGAQTTMEATLMSQQTPSQREKVVTARRGAIYDPAVPKVA